MLKLFKILTSKIPLIKPLKSQKVIAFTNIQTMFRPADIDTTEIIADKKSAKWTYKNNKGFMSMVGHIADKYIGNIFARSPKGEPHG